MLELSPPPAGVAPVGELRDGSHIELDADSRYPTTEEVLSSLGMVVNKGNLASLQDLTDEVYYDKAYGTHFANQAAGRTVLLSTNVHF